MAARCTQTEIHPQHAHRLVQRRTSGGRTASGSVPPGEVWLRFRPRALAAGSFANQACDSAWEMWICMTNGRLGAGVRTQPLFLRCTKWAGDALLY